MKEKKSNSNLLKQQLKSSRQNENFFLVDLPPRFFCLKSEQHKHSRLPLTLTHDCGCWANGKRYEVEEKWMNWKIQKNVAKSVNWSSYIHFTLSSSKQSCENENTKINKNHEENEKLKTPTRTFHIRISLRANYWLVSRSLTSLGLTDMCIMHFNAIFLNPPDWQMGLQRAPCDFLSLESVDKAELLLEARTFTIQKLTRY